MVLFSFLEKCVLPFHFAQSSVSAISNSRHDNVRASLALFIWLNENVLFSFLKSAFSRHDNARASSALFIWLNENVRIYLLRLQLNLLLNDEKGGSLAS